MEIKAVTEYEEPKYVTKEESKNKMLRFIMNVKNFSIPICMVLLLNNIVSAYEDWSSLNIETPPVVVGTVDPKVVYSLFGHIEFCLLCITFILFICGIVYLKNLRKIDDEEKREKTRKRGKLCLIVGIALLVFCMILGYINTVSWDEFCI